MSSWEVDLPLEGPKRDAKFGPLRENIKNSARKYNGVVKALLDYLWTELCIAFESGVGTLTINLAKAEDPTSPDYREKDNQMLHGQISTSNAGFGHFELCPSQAETDHNNPRSDGQGRKRKRVQSDRSRSAQQDDAGNDPTNPVAMPAEPPSPGMTPPRIGPTNAEKTMSENPPQTVSTSIASTGGQDKSVPTVAHQRGTFGIVPTGTNHGDGFNILLEAAAQTDSRSPRINNVLYTESQSVPETVDPSKLEFLEAQTGGGAGTPLSMSRWFPTVRVGSEDVSGEDDPDVQFPEVARGSMLPNQLADIDTEWLPSDTITTYIHLSEDEAEAEL